MKRYTEKIRLRLQKKELDYLMQQFEKSEGTYFKDGRGNFSGFLRAQLLENSNYKNIRLEKQMRELQYEFRKIGVNVNQIAKKINSGLGSPSDVETVKEQLADLKELLEHYQKEVERVWELPN